MKRLPIARSAAIAALASLPSTVWAQQAPAPYWPMHEYMWWWGPWHMLMPLVILGLIVAGIVFLVRHLWPGSSAPHRRSALDVLDDRYARGEIDREEYMKRRSDISGS